MTRETVEELLQLLESRNYLRLRTRLEEMLTIKPDFHKGDITVRFETILGYGGYKRKFVKASNSPFTILGYILSYSHQDLTSDDLAAASYFDLSGSPCGRFKSNILTEGTVVHDGQSFELATWVKFCIEESKKKIKRSHNSVYRHTFSYAKKDPVTGSYAIHALYAPSKKGWPDFLGNP